MPTIILKKTFKIKPAGWQVAHEKSFSFHGSAVNQDLIYGINQKLKSLRYTHSARPVQFVRDNAGHYYAAMNHDCQKYHEEDAICAILDTMELLGWTFRFQYDSESSSTKVTGASFTSRELFLFHQSPGRAGYPYWSCSRFFLLNNNNRIEDNEDAISLNESDHGRLSPFLRLQNIFGSQPPDFNWFTSWVTPNLSAFGLDRLHLAHEKAAIGNGPLFGYAAPKSASHCPNKVLDLDLFSLKNVVNNNKVFIVGSTTTLPKFAASCQAIFGTVSKCTCVELFHTSYRNWRSYWWLGGVC